MFFTNILAYQSGRGAFEPETDRYCRVMQPVWPSKKILKSTSRNPGYQIQQ